MDVVQQLKQFMQPKSMAIIGASRRTGEEAFSILENLLSYDYQGRVYPVNPNASEILGVKTYPSIGKLPEKVDLVVITLPRSLVPGVVKECVDTHISAITIVTQGFTDAADEEGKRLQNEIDNLIKGNETRILGPNTFGTANAYIDFSSSFIQAKMEKIPVGLICQTGAFFEGFANVRLLGKGIDLGNACDIDLADALEYFEQDADIKVIALHIEGVRDGRRFLEAAKRAAAKKPVVALKTGRSGQAAQAAQSHTGSLAGKDEIWDSALKEAGVIRASDIVDFCDVIRAFYVLPSMPAEKIGIATYTGGYGIMAVDACERFGLELAQLSSATVNRLSALSPSWLAVGNPVDIWPAVMISKHPLSQMEQAAVKSLLGDEQVNAVLCIFNPITPALYIEMRQMVEEVTQDYPDKPVVFHIFGPLSHEAKIELEKTGKTLAFPSADRAVRVLSHLANYSQLRLNS